MFEHVLTTSAFVNEKKRITTESYIAFVFGHFMIYKGLFCFVFFI